MKTVVESFGPEHLEAAATLFAARHACDRTRRQHLPPEYESPSEVYPLLTDLLEQDGAQGVVAKREDEVVGYLLGRAMLTAPYSPAASIWRPRSASVPYAGYAARPDGAHDVYREMYAALSEQWVSGGLFAHYVSVNAFDPATLEAFYSLGFARDTVRAVRPVEMPVEAGGAAGVCVRQATLDDVEVVLRLQLDLFAYHSSAPIYAPFLPEAFAGQRSYAEELLTSPECAVLLAVQGERAIGLQTLKPVDAQPGAPARTMYLTEGYTDEEARGTGVASALLAESMEWARSRGYEWCMLNFLPTNILAARFWMHSGFEPLGYRMIRAVDERIAWARR